MAKIIITNLKGGLATEHWQAVNTIREAADNQFATGIVDTISNPNVIQPTNNVFTNITNFASITDSTVATKMLAVDDYTNSFFGVAQLYWGQNNLIHRINPGIQTLVITGGFPRVINPATGVHATHTNEQVEDVALYRINNAHRLFYFFRDSHDADAGTFDLNAGFTAEENAFSGAAGGVMLNRNFPVIAEAADNGFMYVGNGNAIYRFDGNASGGINGTVSLGVDIDPIWSITDLKDYRGKMLIMAKKGITISNEIREYAMFIWNRISTTLSFDDIILINGVFDVSRIFFYNNVPCIFTREATGNSTTISLRVFDGYRFVIKKALFSPDADYDFANIKVAAVQYANGLVFLGSMGRVYFLEDPMGEARLHCVGLLSIGANDKVIGGLHVGTVGRFFYFPHRINSPAATTIRSWAMGETARVGFGSFFTKVYELPKLSRIKSITVYYQPFTSTANKNFSINLYKNMNSSGELPNDLTINYAAEGAVGWKYFPLNIENANTIQLLISHPTGETIANSLKISRIEIDHEPTTKLM